MRLTGQYAAQTSILCGSPATAMGTAPSLRRDAAIARLAARFTLKERMPAARLCVESHPAQRFIARSLQAFVAWVRAALARSVLFGEWLACWRRRASESGAAQAGSPSPRVTSPPKRVT